MLKKYIFLTLSILPIFVFLSTYLKADEPNRYKIIESDGRTFLLDTRTGTTWRYFFNSVEEQGWTKLYFYRTITEKECSISETPYGESITFEK